MIGPPAETVPAGHLLLRRVRAADAEPLQRLILGRGYATVAAGALTTEAFARRADVCGIRHDAANRASGRVAEKLGYRWIRAEPHSIDAPGQTGTGWVWEMRAGDWPGTPEE